MSKELRDIRGIGKKTADRLNNAGITSIFQLANLSVKELLELGVKGIGEATAGNYIERAKNVSDQEEGLLKTTKSSLSESKKLHKKGTNEIADIESNTLKALSKFFEPEFIKGDELKDKLIIKNLLDASVSAFKFLTKGDVNFINAVLMCKKINELSKYRGKNLYNFISTSQLETLESNGVDVKKMKNRIQKAITISSILDNLREEPEKVEKQLQKVIIAGLDQAGKTAILNTFGEEIGINYLSQLRPTRKVNRREIETEDMKLYVWDFGGQSNYRHSYLQNPGTYFLNVNLLVYVIDVQDHERFEESFSYLEDILHALNMLEEEPQIIILIHKMDPDIREDAEVELNVEFVKENLREILLGQKFDYEIYLTSIYSFISKEPKFSRFLKKLIRNRELIADPTSDKLEEIGKIVRNALEAIVKLSESVSTQFDQFNERLSHVEKAIHDKNIQTRALEITKTNQTAESSLSSLKPPPNPKSPESSSQFSPQQGSAQGAIINELKKLFSKVKRKEY